MAENISGNVTIRINGKEVDNTLKALQRETRVLRQDLRNMTIGTDEYNRTVKQLQATESILKKHTANINGMAGGWKSMLANFVGGAGGGLGGAFLGATGPLGLLTAGATALFGILRSGIQHMKEFEKALSDLKVRTGITEEGIVELKDAAIELGMAYGQAPKDIIKAFGEAASARPELIKNTQALTDFTEQAVILAQVTGVDVNESIKNLTTIMNTNAIATTDTASTVDILVGAAQKGAKEVDFLSQAMQKIGGTAKNANVGLAEQAAVLEVLGEKYTSSAETAGTNVRNILIILQQEWAKSNEGPFNFQKALEDLSPQVRDITSLTELFGKENVVAAQTLIENRGQVEKLTGEISNFKDTNIALFDSQDNLDAQTNKLSARFEGYWATMSGSNGVITAAVGGIDMMLDGIETFVSRIGTAINLIFDTEQTLVKLRIENDKKVLDQRLESAKALVQNQGLKDAKDRLIEMYEASKKLTENSKEWNDLRQKAIFLERAISDEEKANAVAEDNAAKEKQAAADNFANAQADNNRKARAAADAAAKERLQELNDQREIIKNENAKLEKIGGKGLERGADFKGLEGAGDLKTDPLQPTRDLEQQKQELFLESFEKQLEQIGEFEERKAALQTAADQEARERTIEAGVAAYSALGPLVFDVIEANATRRTNRELKELDEKKKKGILSEEEYAKQRDAIEREAFVKKKRRDLAQIAINTAVAVARAPADTGAIGAALVVPLIIAQGAAQAAIVALQEYGDGGMIEGPSHSNGGVPAILEGGELVIKKKSVNAMTIPVLNAINETGSIPSMNFSGMARAVKLERGGSVGGSEYRGSSAPDGVMLEAILGKFVEKINEKQVKFNVTDYNDFTDRNDRVQIMQDI